MARHGYDALPWWRRPRPSFRQAPAAALGIPLLGLGVLIALVGLVPGAVLAAYLARPANDAPATQGISELSSNARYLYPARNPSLQPSHHAADTALGPYSLAASPLPMSRALS